MELFHLWFTKHFLQHVVSARPLLLLVDGYTYLQLVVQKQYVLYAILFMLQPHTTHKMPPLNITVFLSLKTHGKTFVKIIYSTILPESLPNINLVAHSHKHGEQLWSQFQTLVALNVQGFTLSTLRQT